MYNGLRIATLVLAAGSLRAQVSVTPSQPQWGQTLEITYDPLAKGAQFKRADPVWVSASIYLEDQSLRRVAARMTSMPDGRFRYQATVPDGACLFEIAFVTPHDYDAKAATSLVIFRPDGKPARGAYDHLMWNHTGDPDRYFQQEIDRYPDNLAAYRHRWFLSNGGREEEIATIRADLEKIGPSPQNPGAEWFYAMAYGRWRLGDPAEARSAMENLLHQFPESPLTSDALNYYIFRASGEAKREAQQWERDLVIAHPQGPHAGFTINSLASQPEFPFETVQAVTREQLKREPENPAPYLALANASLAHRRDYAQALSGLQTALGLLLEGKYRVVFDVAGTLTRNRLSETYLLRARIHLAQDDIADALADVKAAENFERERNAAGHLLEGTIWSALSDWSRAEAALAEAWRRDPAASEAPLRQAFERNRGTAAGFAAFLDANRVDAKESQQTKRAFPFDATSLEGKHWSLSELKGKTVVLNFWFVGCLPCREEIPVLNQLVELYPDVVFLGFALDGEEALRDFLKKFPFRYQIIPNSQKVADAFHVAAYPQHVVINPGGEIILETNEDLAALKSALAR